MYFVIFFLCASAAAVMYLLLQRHQMQVKIDKALNTKKIRHLRSLKEKHELASSLSDMIDKDGAGTWPPRAVHDSWPMALRPYKEIYLELNTLLPAADPSLDDEVNTERRTRYRSAMSKLLSERVNVSEVEAILRQTEAGDFSILSRDAYNGFYCAVAVCRHAYRWATIPVVKVAQLEKVVDFPMELDVPWPYLQKNFGVTAESGNNTANVLHNFNERGERVYKINVGLSKLITSSEECFFRMFFDLEVLAAPVYYDMVLATVRFNEGDKAAAADHLEKVISGLRDVLLIFYMNLTESRVSHSVWLSYVQGFQGWGVGRMVNGEFIKYDGLSGNHVLFFQAIDAFLGMNRYLTDENMIRYIPKNQRDLCIALKKHSFRDMLDESDSEDVKIRDQFTKIVNHMKVFRAAHRTRVMPYLLQPAPERLTMTAGKSVLEGPSTKDTREALKVLDDMLVVRLRETI